MSNLEEIRKEIDKIDDELHALLMKRASYIDEIKLAKAKETSNKGVFNPARQVEILRRLLSNHRGNFPKEVLVRIWNEIMGAFVRQQDDFKISVYMPVRGAGFLEITRDTFGADTDIKIHSSIGQIIKDVLDKSSAIGIVPLRTPATAENNRWWHSLTSSNKHPRVILRLPLTGAREGRGGGEEAFALSNDIFTATGKDVTLLVAEMDNFAGNDNIEFILNEQGQTMIEILDSVSLLNTKAYLVEVGGFIEEDSEVFTNIKKQGLAKDINFSIIGHYPKQLSTTD